VVERSSSGPFDDQPQQDETQIAVDGLTAYRVDERFGQDLFVQACVGPARLLGSDRLIEGFPRGQSGGMIQQMEQGHALLVFTDEGGQPLRDGLIECQDAAGDQPQHGRCCGDRFGQRGQIEQRVARHALLRRRQRGGADDITTYDACAFLHQ